VLDVSSAMKMGELGVLTYIYFKNTTYIVNKGE